MERFEDKWIQWWSAAQPEWRCTGGWPFAKEDAAGRDWGRLLDGGKDCLYLVVVSLGWWILAHNHSEGSRVNDAIMDVSWVLNNLVSCLAADATTSNSPPNPPHPPFFQTTEEASQASNDWTSIEATSLVGVD